jgi:hypothetical protein
MPKTDLNLPLLPKTWLEEKGHKKKREHTNQNAQNWPQFTPITQNLTLNEKDIKSAAAYKRRKREQTNQNAQNWPQFAPITQNLTLKKTTSKVLLHKKGSAEKIRKKHKIVYSV